MAEVSPHDYVVILAGGGGTRLWPKSRQKLPKHLLQLVGEETMLQLTYQRIVKILPKEKIFIITHKDHLVDAQEQLPDLPKDNWIVEPKAKNTALAMGVAAAYIYKKDPEAVIINSPADHIINDQVEFEKAYHAALKAAETYPDNIIAVGIQPTFAHTGLGYIKLGEQIDTDVYEIYKCLGFKEKPDLTTAQSFLDSGEYLWNANYYCWKATELFAAFKKYSPSIHTSLEKIIDGLGTPQEQSILEQVYNEAESMQIDIAVSEKADNLLVIPGKFDWSDVGDWKVVHEMSEQDENGNVVVNASTDHINIDSENCFVESGEKTIVTIGLKDIVVVDTPDALLICHKDKTQDVKKVVEKLKEDKKHHLL